MLLFKRGPKALRRAQRALGAPKPSAGARRRGAERPELLVYFIFHFFLLFKYKFVPIKLRVIFPHSSSNHGLHPSSKS